MIKVVCHTDSTRLPPASSTTIPVLLYGTCPRTAGSMSIGAPLIRAVRRLAAEVPQVAFDFLSVALAVTAADTFVRREEAADGWSRQLELVIPVVNARPWLSVIKDLENALNFLSGDIWTLNVRGDGRCLPKPQRTGRITKVSGHDCVCLFSGGLDSAIGALNLVAGGRKPLLASHSYRGDSSKQDDVWTALPGSPPRFSANANPVSPKTSDTTMRTRSLNFLAYGAVAGSALSTMTGGMQVPLYVPENGLISLNPPLTRRRIGALSTRTTHPFFLEIIQRIFDRLAIPVIISNPYRFKTKGEMIRDCADPQNLRLIADTTVSCGKWKRTGRQCGRCVPCLIRRAAFHAAGWADATDYRSPDLATVLDYENERDDLLAMMVAVKKAETAKLDNWVSLSGPLPADLPTRAMHIDVFSRGIEEMRVYLRSAGLIQ